MPFRYSAFTVMMPEYTLAEAAALLKELGYDGVEWRVHSVPQTPLAKTDFWRGNKATIDLDTILNTAKDIRQITLDAGLEIVGLGTYLSYKMTAEVERCMEAARIMGCRSIRVSPPSYDGTENYNDLYEEAVDGFMRIEELAKEYRVRANIELHVGNICPSASLGYRFVQNFDPDQIGVIFDPGNMIIEGHENWQMGLDLLGPYLSHVHVKNVAWAEDSTSEDGVKQWKPVMKPMKEGMVQWDKVLLALDRAGYKGWLSFEDFAPGDTKKKLAEDLAFLKGLETTLGI